LIDIDVEGSRRYGIIEQGSRAHKSLLQMRTMLITARLSSESGAPPFLKPEVVARVLGFKPQVASIELGFLVRIGILDPIRDPNYEFMGFERESYVYSNHGYDLGFCLGRQALDAIAAIKAGEDLVRFPFP
jgi:hypothetical protein